VICSAILRYDYIERAEYPREYRQEQDKQMRDYVDFAATPVEAFRFIPVEYTGDMAEAEGWAVHTVVLAAPAD